MTASLILLNLFTLSYFFHQYSLELTSLFFFWGGVNYVNGNRHFSTDQVKNLFQRLQILFNTFLDDNNTIHYTGVMRSMRIIVFLPVCPRPWCYFSSTKTFYYPVSPLPPVKGKIFIFFNISLNYLFFSMCSHQIYLLCICTGPSYNSTYFCFFYM